MAKRLEKVGLNAVELAFVEEGLNMQRRQLLWKQNSAMLVPIVNAMAKLQIEPRLTTTSLDFSFTGDAEKLAAAMRILRTGGWEFRAERPKHGDTSWSTYFSHKDCGLQIWFAFYSSVCRRVQVGTEFKEVPIYETVCGDAPPEVEVCVPQVTSETESTPLLTAPEVLF
jgi:hypothetical protein